MHRVMNAGLGLVQALPYRTSSQPVGPAGGADVSGAADGGRHMVTEVDDVYIGGNR